MRLSELTGKEVINLTDATRLGVVRNVDALIETDTGEVKALLVPFQDQGPLWTRHPRTLAVPWHAVRRFGSEIVIVEIRTPTREERRHGTITAREEKDTSY